jgi:hypothetical protein
MSERRIRIKAALPRLLLIASFEWHLGHFTAWHSSPLVPANTSDALRVARNYFPRMTNTPQISYCEHDLDRRTRRYVQVCRILRQHGNGPCRPPGPPPMVCRIHTGRADIRTYPQRVTPLRILGVGFRCTWPFAPRTSAFSRSEKPRICQPCSVKMLNGVPHSGGPGCWVSIAAIVDRVCGGRKRRRFPFSRLTC